MTAANITVDLRCHHLLVEVLIMPCYRFYINSTLVRDAKIILQGDQLHHMKNVMRIRVGEIVQVINGRNQLAQATIDRYQGNQSGHLTLHHVYTKEIPDKPAINLIQPLTRSKGLDLVIEKCTELGVKHFYLYGSQQGEITSLSSGRQNKLTQIAISALKQSGRLDLPTFTFADRLHDLKIEQDAYPVCFGDTRHLNDDHVGLTPQLTLANYKSVCIGPEQGFSDMELHYLQNQIGASGIKISPFTLRSETASIAITTLVAHANLLTQ